VTYVLTEENSLDLSFKAIATKPTPINLANHVYFNLGEAIMNCFGTETNYTIII
jgi:galactose mutarotase-like enzyme